MRKDNNRSISRIFLYIIQKNMFFIEDLLQFRTAILNIDELRLRVLEWHDMNKSTSYYICSKCNKKCQVWYNILIPSQFFRNMIQNKNLLLTCGVEVAIISPPQV